MNLHQPHTRRRIAMVMAALLFVVLGGSLFSFVPKVHAAFNPSAAAAGLLTGACTGSVPCPAVGDYRFSKELQEGEVGPSVSAALLMVLLNLWTFATDRLAYEAALFIATGDKGQSPLFFGDNISDSWDKFGLDIAGEAVGLLRDDLLPELGLQYDICAPGDLINLAFALGIQQAYKPRAPRCDFREVQKNWGAFVTRTVDTLEDPKAAILSTFASGLRPGQNELSAGITLNIKVQEKVLQAKSGNVLDQLAGDGYKAVTDLVTGKIKTPASVLREQFNREVASVGNKDDVVIETVISNSDLLWYMFAHMASTFTNTLFSSLIQRVYTGLFAPQLDIDPFDLEGAAVAGREAATERFANLITANPIVQVNYNALSEFVICPTSGGVAVRNVNNCVMDTNFVAAVARAQASAPLTVQEAIDQGLLHGDWPLISSGDAARNQDPNCYTYGYCHGNLVKLRKARIIPVGWEIAASRSDPSEPITLQEVIDGFDRCNENGTIDNGENRWCHLIDPNWVLKYPDTQCRALVNGELLATSLGSTRASSCVDTPSCISENNDGTCSGGYGYCVREKNTWRFRGEECPAQYASCLSFENTFTRETGNWLLNTTDFSVCNADNAGCRWYRTNQYLDDKGTPDEGDDTYEWLPTGSEYVVQTWDEAIQYQGSERANTPDGLYAYEDRVYFNNNVEQCTAAEAGCSRLYPARDGLRLNLVANPSFEDDADDDGVPDFWQWGSAPAPGGEYETSGTAFHGSDAILTGQGANTAISQRNIALASNSFYTLSAYVQGNAPDAGGSVTIEISDTEGNPVDLTGTSFEGGCVPRIVGGQRVGYVLMPEVLSTAEFQRLTCTFTTVSGPSLAFITAGQPNVRFDAVQLELGENVSDFTTDYSSASPQTAYLRVPPDYLGCTGAPTDPPECDAYTQVCSAQDVGCNRYTPEGGNPAIPAVVSDLDRCPVECVGYSAFKQEATRYEQEKFPLYFIADRAAACQQQFVGCDSFTNLDTVATGGEGIEYYTNLRACLKPADAGAQAQTYFTWEGSDASGYQLVTWQLLESNVNPGTTIGYTQIPPAVPPSDAFASLAPCTKWRMNSASVLVCEDDDIALAGVDDCNEHSDIFTNPDCREFYDSAGNIHYRSFSATVTISDACHPYRKTESTQSDCQATGGFWSASGECRYFGLTEESVACPAAANGCREYTGGAGRNASTIASLDFENGTAADVSTTGALNSVVISNESVATDGHSLRVEAAAAGGGIYGSVGNVMVPGKTFVFEFWAKGSGPIRVALVEGGPNGAVVHDFVNPGNPVGTVSDLALTGGWQPYTLGPIDTSKPGFTINNDTVLRLTSASGATVFYLDNIRLKQTEENVTVIKDSWVVPATCDMAPTGVAAPQYYLGCEAYTDQNGEEASLYQFSRLCSEAVVGCEAFYDTQNSSSPYAQAFNVRCQYDTDNNALTEELVSQNTACIVNGATQCTIAVGRSFCLFDLPAAIPSPLPDASNSDFRMVLGPEAAVVQNDTTSYLVDDGSTTCSAASMGCEEIGVPKYSQDKTRVESFESAYSFNLPDNYSDILCDNEALFCEEWSSTKDGNFYFKDPLDKICEYRANVQLGAGQDVSGWFKSGTNEPCDPSYLIAGEQYGIWRNGDANYDGWVGACDSQYDLCTEFIDSTDTGEGQFPNGTSYFFLDNETLDESNLQGAQPCDGQVSQKNGCVLFNDRTVSELPFASGPTYVASTHADVLFGAEPFSLQEPINCALEPVARAIQTPSGETVDLCSRRCQYDVGLNNDLKIGNAIPAAAGGVTEFTGSCLMDADCPALEATDGELYAGSCFTFNPNTSANIVQHNDANTVIKVNRDRECSQWLACSSSKLTWNTRTGRYETICDQVRLCAQYATTAGESAFCTKWVDEEPLPLSSERYASRAVDWNGLEYSGNAIPNQLPVQFYNQINVNPPLWCVDAAGNPQNYDPDEGLYGTICETDADCSGGTTCEFADPAYRLSYVAGPCDEATDGRSGQCFVGFCQQSGNPCSLDADCGTGDQCVVGYCQVIFDPTFNCTSNAQCAGKVQGGVPTPICDTRQARCVNQLTPNNTTCDRDDVCASGGTCTLAAVSKEGACFNNQCITDISGNPFRSPAEAEAASCRGYPEGDSPFPATKVVEQWLNPEETVANRRFTSKEQPSGESSQASTLKFGYQSVNVCAPVCDENGCHVSDDCVFDCAYDKAEYGDGSGFRYYPAASITNEILQGVCVGGPFAGKGCEEDTECATNGGTGGTCARLSHKDTLFGWPGYCIERDTSIQLYGSTASMDQACLTWLPVDQLIGATDLYGKYVNAGYAPQDTFYCADTAVYYDLNGPGTNDDACAESSGGCEDTPPGDQWIQESAGDEDAENCWRSARCPDGYFGVITGCGDAAPQLGQDAMCADTDDDCPFFCVPKLSFQSSDDAACLPPGPGGPVERATEISITGRNDSNGFPIYLVRTDDYITAREFYAGCQVRGLDQDAFNAYRAGAGRQTDDLFGDDGYRNRRISYDSYLACSSLVQVGSDSLETQVSQGLFAYNTAWTNRTWLDIIPPYTLQSAVAELNYLTTTFLQPFGIAMPISEYMQRDEFDTRPERLVMCDANNGQGQVIAGPDLQCPDGYSVSDPNAQQFMFARPYQDVELTCEAAIEDPLCSVDVSALDGQPVRVASFKCDQLINPRQDDVIDVCVRRTTSDPNSTARQPYEETVLCTQNLDVFLDDGTYCTIVINGTVATASCPAEPGAEELCAREGNSSLCDQTNPQTVQCGGNLIVNTPTGETTQDAENRMRQIFARSFALFSWQNPSSVIDITNSDVSGLWDIFLNRQRTFPERNEPNSNYLGWYQQADSLDTWAWDNTAEGLSGPGPRPPIVISIGNCTDAKCREGAQGKFTANGIDTGNLLGGNGQEHVAVSFFTAANRDQMPIRKVMVDWGDGNIQDPMPWPTTSQSGSRAGNNFYQNHRGLTESGQEICRADAREWGLTPDSCDTSYVTFTHDYVCTEAFLEDLDLRACEVDASGRLTNSPCTGGDVPAGAGKCVFQPRVHVLDNWGWCTGFCDDVGALDGTTNCYATECDISACPSEGRDPNSRCPDSTQGTTNPWVNFDGYVIVEP